jgi:hypothetical protein
MTIALLYLAFISWTYSSIAQMHIPKTRYLSTSEVQDLIAGSKGHDIHFTLFQRSSGVRRLFGSLDENGVHSTLLAPAENSTMALLAKKGISYETKIEGRDVFPEGTRLAWWSGRLLNPFCCFLLVAGAITLLRGRHHRQSEPHAITGPTKEHRVDRAFAALAACGMLAMAVAVGLTTDWNVRRIAADQVANVIAERSNARFEVFEYSDGSKKLWISDLHSPDFIAPADGSTLGLLKRQGMTYQTYVATEIPGVAGRPGWSQSTTVLWIVLLTAAAGSLSWWVVKGRLFRQARLQTSAG